MPKKTKAKAGVTSASAIMDRRFFNTPEKRAALADTRLEMMLGDKIRRVREDAGLSQAALADRIGTTASAICRIEDADYDGHSVATLQRIAHALGLLLTIDYVKMSVVPEAKRM